MDNLILKLILLVSFQGWYVKNEETCQHVTRTLPKHGSSKFRGLEEEMHEAFEDCEGSACLFINDYTGSRLYKVCKCSDSSCAGEAGVDGTTPTVRTQDVTTASSKVRETRSSDSLAIGLLVFGMALGSVTMTIVCLFLPNLHRNASRCLNRKAIRNRQSQATVMSGITEPTYQHPGQQAEQFYHQTSLSNDQLPQVEPSEYQSIDAINQGEPHVYSELHGHHNVYNEPGVTSVSVNLIEHDINADNAEGVIMEPRNDLVGGILSRNVLSSGQDCKEDGYLRPESKRHTNGEKVEPTYLVLEEEQ